MEILWKILFLKTFSHQEKFYFDGYIDEMSQLNIQDGALSKIVHG